jgi:AraC-like DNA-binding protein
MQNEIKRSILSSVMQIRNQMDMRLQEMERIALNISFNSNLKYHRISNSNYDSMEAIRELAQYKSSSGFMYDIALYYNNKPNSGNNRIYTTMTSVTLDVFFRYIYQYENRGKGHFLNIVNKIDAPTMYPTSHVLVNNSQKDELAVYIYPMAVDTVKSYLDVVFFIQKDTLDGMLKNALGDYNGYVYVVDMERNPIFYHASDKLAPEPETVRNTLDYILDHHKDVETIDINKSKYSATSISSEYNGWSYIVIRETSQMIADVNVSRSTYLYVVVFVSIFGLVMAFLLANGQYKPWKVLVGTILDHDSKYNNNNKAACSNEFDYVMKTIMGAFNENKDLASQLRSKSAIIRSQFITKLLNGKITESEYADELKTMKNIYGLKWEHPYFLVLVFLIDDYGPTDANSQKDMQDLAMFSIINVTEELAEESGHGYGVESADGKRVILLLNLKSDYTKERYISEIAFRTKDFFTKYFGITLTVGVGNICNSKEMIHESFLEANRAVYYRLIKGYGNVIFYEDIKESQKQIYQYPAMLEQELIIAIKGGKADEARRVILAIKEHIITNSMNIEAVQCICFGIINTILKVLNDLNLDMSQCFTNEEEVLFSQPFGTIDGFMDRIASFCSTICGYIQNQKESKNFELREQIVNMVKNNYKDSALSLDRIALEFNMSPSYISRYFKDQTGYSLMQYVDMLRMKEVKKLLQETNIPLKTIIEQVGYVDKSSFYRKFKKKEGTTPAQYRSLTKKGQNVSMQMSDH